MNARAKEMAAAIKAETNGRFDLQIFPNNQLGSDTDMLSQIRSGGIEFFTLSGLILATLVPAASINGIGFAFPDYDTVWKAMDGDLGAYVRGEIAKANLVVMDKIWDNGFRQTTSSTKPINSPDDLQGLQDPRAGLPALDLDVQGVRRLPGLDQFQRGLFGAADQDRRRPGKSAGDHLDGETLRSAEILLADQPHVGRFLVPRQPPRLGEGARRTCAPSSPGTSTPPALKEREDTAKLNASLQQELAGKGLTFNQPDVAPFREKLRSAGFYAEWKGKYGDQAWALLEKSVGKLS